MNSCPFIALTEEGKNALWRYALSFVLIVAIVLAGSSVITLPITLGAVPESSTVGFALELLGMGAMLLGALLVTRLLHGRSPSTLFGVARRLNWMVILSSGAVWAVLMAISVGINFVLSPQQFTVNAKFFEFLPTLLVGLVLIPLQTSAEEVLFRGYLLQAIGRVVRPPVLLSVLNGVLFVVPHLGNPEAQQETGLAAVQWFMGGFLPALLTLRHGTLDAALGIHAANNLFSFALVGYQINGESVLPPAAPVIQTEYDYGFYAVSSVVTSLIAYLVLARAQPVRSSTTPQAAAA